MTSGGKKLDAFSGISVQFADAVFDERLDSTDIDGIFSHLEIDVGPNFPVIEESILQPAPGTPPIVDDWPEFDEFFLDELMLDP